MEKKKSILAQWCQEIKEGLKEGFSLKAHEASSLCYTGKVKTQEEMFHVLQKHIYEEIRYKCEKGEKYLLIEYPIYLDMEYISKIRECLLNLGYKITFEDNNIVVITWRKK